jgi:hypothetical protein
VKDQVADAIGGNRTAQQPSGAQDRFLADEIIELARPQPVGQGRQTLQQGVAMLLEQIRHQCILLAPSSNRCCTYPDP